MSKLPAEILAGRHDDELTAIAEALTERIKADEVDAYWVIRLKDGPTISYKNIKWGTWTRFEKRSDIGNARFNFNALGCTADQIAVFLACWKEQEGADYDKALAEVQDWGHDAFEADIEVEASDVPFDD